MGSGLFHFTGHLNFLHSARPKGFFCRVAYVLVTKCIKSGGKSQFSLSFLPSAVNDARRKLYMVGIYLTVEKRAKRMPDATFETTAKNESRNDLFA